MAYIPMNAQTLLTEAEDFHVKTIEGEPIFLFPLLDEQNKIVVIDFFSTTCGPCQDFADDFQASYEAFGSNEANVYFMGINWGNDNEGVREFDSIFGLTFPTASGVQGGGNIVFNDYQVQSYPTVIVIKPDHEISNQYVWEPSYDNINDAVIEAGGVMVGRQEISENEMELRIYPNPTKTMASLGFYLNANADVLIQIIGINSQMNYEYNLKNLEKGNQEVEINTSQLKPGFYMVNLISSKGENVNTKLIVN